MIEMFREIIVDGIPEWVLLQEQNYISDVLWSLFLTPVLKAALCPFEFGELLFQDVQIF